MEFAAIDFETANADLASICQVGIAVFRDSELIELWSSLIDPQDYFSPVNISIHGITESDVLGKPTWDQAFPDINRLINERVAVSHTAFDRVAFHRACLRAEIEPTQTRWLDSARVTRRVWKQFAQSGYGLSNISKHLGISYKAHDALEDARAAGIVLVQAMAEKEVDLEGLFDLVSRPISGETPVTIKISRGGNPEGEMFGEVLVFTGSLSIPRAKAADMAASVGCAVDPGVTKETTILVVGNQDIRYLAGKEKSSKHIKAETLILKGQQIRILTEHDFEQVVLHHHSL